MWNRLCKLIEKNKLASLQQILSPARLFVFDKPAQEFLPTEFTPEMEKAVETVRLPFPCIAIEDPGGLVAIVDNPDATEAPVGLNQPRVFIEYMTSGTDSSVYDPRVMARNAAQGVKPFLEDYGERIDQMAPGADIIFVGKLSDVSWDTRGLKATIEVIHFYSFLNDELEHYFGGDTLEDMKEKLGEVIPNWSCALQELVYFMHPKNFILETKPKKIRKPGKKTPRKHERSIYTVLEPGVIRETMGLSCPAAEGGERTAHERRGHNRALRHERYGESRGKTIWIQPTWIGPSEAVVGNKKYKVRLDI